GESIAAVVGRRPLGDGDADERGDAGRHDGAGVRDGTSVRAAVLRPAARDGDPVGDGGAVLHARPRVHGVRIPRAAIRRAHAIAGGTAVSRRTRLVARRDAGGAVGG